MNRDLLVGLGPLGLRYILRAGGMGYFRKGVVAQHIEAGELEAVEGAPEITYPAYAIYPEASEGRSDVQEVLPGLKEVGEVIACRHEAEVAQTRAGEG